MTLIIKLSGFINYLKEINLTSRNGWKTNSSRLKLDTGEVSCYSSSSLFHILHLFLCMNSTFPLFKGTVKVISSDPPCKDLYLIIMWKILSICESAMHSLHRGLIEITLKGTVKEKWKRYRIKPENFRRYKIHTKHLSDVPVSRNLYKSCVKLYENIYMKFCIKVIGLNRS